MDNNTNTSSVVTNDINTSTNTNTNTNRISIHSLGAVPEAETIYLQVGDTTIEVRRSIPYVELLNTMQWVIDMVVGEQPFMSAPLSRIVKDFAILNAYTNLDLGVTHPYEEVADLYAEYDIIQYFGVMENVLPKLDARQIAFFEDTVDKTMESILQYRNSAKGIVDILAGDADKDVNKMEKAMELFTDPEQQKQIATIIKAAENIQGE